MQIKLIDRLRSRLTSSYDMTEGTDILRNTGCIECYLQLIFRRVLDISDAVSILWPLLKNEWVEMGDPAPPRRRTHGGTGAGVLALVKPLPPKAVAAGQALQGPSIPGYDRHRRTDGLPFKAMRSRQASCRALRHPFEIQ